MAAMEKVLAVDVGGTKMACGVVDTNGVLLDRGQIPTTDNPDGNELFAGLAELIKRFAPFDQYIACGVGCGGD